MFRVFILLLSLNSFISFAESVNPAADLTDSITRDYPNLGMKILSVENGSHTLVSNNQRYVIKGKLLDMWEGVESSYIDPGTINIKQAKKVFEHISKKDFTITIGNPDGIEIDVFTNYFCKTCENFVKSITKTSFLDKYKVNIFLVYTDRLDLSIADDVYCSENKVERFTKRYVDRDITNLDGECKSLRPHSSVSYANLLPVKSLPASLGPNNRLYYGVLPKTY